MDIKISLKIGGKVIVFTPNEIKELREALDKLDGNREIRHIPYYPPYYPDYPHWYCDGTQWTYTVTGQNDITMSSADTKKYYASPHDITITDGSA